MSSRYVIGIDLGTSNCAVAFTEPSAGVAARVQDFPVPQLVRPGEVATRALYPSVVYLPFDGEFPEGSLALPWTPVAPALARVNRRGLYLLANTGVRSTGLRGSFLSFDRRT